MGELREYGDLSDVMGRGGAAMPYGLGASALGWGGESLVVPGDSAGVFSVRVGAGRYAGAAVVRDPVSGRRYAVSFRSGGSEFPAGFGVVLHELLVGTAEPGVYGRGSFAHYLPWGTGAVAAGPGVSWVSDSGGVGFDVVEVGASRAVVRVSVDPDAGLSDVSGPVFAVPPEVERVGSGRVYELRVPAAWDQSGVQRSRVFVDGKRRTGSRLGGSSKFVSVVRVNAMRTRSVAVRVFLVDGLGNESGWSTVVAPISR